VIVSSSRALSVRTLVGLRAGRGDVGAGHQPAGDARCDPGSERRDGDVVLALRRIPRLADLSCQHRSLGGNLRVGCAVALILALALGEKTWPPSANVSVDQVGMFARCCTRSDALPVDGFA
jgi:hypothetical protein